MSKVTAVKKGKGGAGGEWDALREGFVALRPWSFPTALVGVALGSALGYNRLGSNFSYCDLATTLLGALSILSAGNLTNSYFDYKYGVDKKETAGDRTMFDNKRLKTSDIRNLMVAFYALAALCALYVLQALYGLYLSQQLPKTRLEIMFGILVLGLVFTWSYTAAPLKLKKRALGDLVIALCFGPLIVEGTYFLQSHAFSFEKIHAFTENNELLNYYLPLWFSIPIVLPIVGILHVNNTRDIVGDRAAGVSTVANLLGKKLSFYYLISLIYGAFVLNAILVLFLRIDRTATIHGVTHHFAKPSWLVLWLPMLALPVSFGIVRDFKQEKWAGSDLCAKTAQFGLLFGVLVSISIVLSPQF